MVSLTSLEPIPRWLGPGLYSVDEKALYASNLYYLGSLPYFFILKWPYKTFLEILSIFFSLNGKNVSFFSVFVEMRLS